MQKQYSFCVKLADVPVGVMALYESTKRFCKDYLTDEPAVFSVEISPSDIDFEREKSAREDEVEQIPPRHFSDAYLETLAVYRKIAAGLLEKDVLLFHGSCIAVDHAAYLFTAKSGTGKSTHTRLWRELFGERALMVNDDKPLLRLTDDGVRAYGTPWDGKHHLSNPVSVPLKAICILERGQENHVETVSRKEVYPLLLQQCYRPADPKKLMLTMKLFDNLTSAIELYRLSCNMEAEAARVAFEGMQKYMIANELIGE